MRMLKAVVPLAFWRDSQGFRSRSEHGSRFNRLLLAQGLALFKPLGVEYKLAVKTKDLY